MLETLCLTYWLFIVVKWQHGSVRARTIFLYLTRWNWISPHFTRWFLGLQDVFKFFSSLFRMMTAVQYWFVTSAKKLKGRPVQDADRSPTVELIARRLIGSTTRPRVERTPQTSSICWFDQEIKLMWYTASCCSCSDTCLALESIIFAVCVDRGEILHYRLKNWRALSPAC